MVSGLTFRSLIHFEFTFVFGVRKYTKWQWKHNSKPMGCNKSSSKKEVYSNTILPQRLRKTSNRPPNFTPKTTG